LDGTYSTGFSGVRGSFLCSLEKLEKMGCNKETTAFQEATKSFCWNLDDQTNSFHISSSLEMAEFFWGSAFMY